jgi:hypothetical protein
MLDAQATVLRNEPEGDPTNYPIATNFTTADATGDPKTAGASGVMGSYSKDELVTDKGSINLHNNPDIPSQIFPATRCKELCLILILLGCRLILNLILKINRYFS